MCIEHIVSWHQMTRILAGRGRAVDVKTSDSIPLSSSSMAVPSPLKNTKWYCHTHFGWWASSSTLLVCFMWFQKCVCLLSTSRTGPCVSQIWTLIHCVKICTQLILMFFLPLSVLIAGLYNCTDDRALQTAWQTTTQHTQTSGFLNWTWFLIFIGED